MNGQWSVLFWLSLNSLLIIFSKAHPTPSARYYKEKDIRRDFLADEVKEEIEAMKERILSELGMSRVPNISHANVSAEEMETMLQLYRRIARETELEEIAAEQEQRTFTFYSYSSSKVLESKLELDSVSKRFSFSLQRNKFLTQTRVSIKSAKLRIPGWPGGQKPRLVIHRLMNTSTDRQLMILVANQTLEPSTFPLIDLDLTDKVLRWVHKPKETLELLMECLHCSDYADLHRTNDKVIEEPAVLELLVTEMPSRVRRSKQVGVNPSNATFLDCTKGFRTKMCCRRSLKISFKEIGWDWIVQPTEFQSFFCKGRCHYKFNSFVTTHALMQSILHGKGHKVPKPCCAPKKLRALDLLYYNDNDPPQLTVTKQKGMIVKDCACL